jgi:hypothetical protein
MNSVAEAIDQRMSVRAFTKQAIPHEQILKLLNLAARAPSGTNTQPWKAYVLEGQKLQILCDQVCAAYDSIASNPELAKDFQEAYDYYPVNGLVHTLIVAVKMAGVYMVCWVSPRAIKIRCIYSIAKIFNSSAHQWVSSLRLIKNLVGDHCLTTECSCRTS